MKIAFADTVYWQALLDVRDDLHTAAEVLAVQLIFDRVRIVTSEMVLTKVLNALGKSERGRALAVSLVESLKADQNVETALNAECPFDAAFAYYKARPDEQWGQTDCSSFVIMQQRGISHALTHDNHFRQAGFATLL
jgi:predicted nucleic acid-binding protein